MANNLIILKIVIISLIILIAIYTDLKTRKIYNILTFPSIVIGIVFNTIIFTIISPSILSFAKGLGFSISGMLIGIVTFFLLFALGWFGGGDAKLMGAIGAFMGPKFIMWCILYTLASGGIFALILVLKDIIKKQNESQIVTFFKSIKNKALYKMPLIMPDKQKSATFTYSTAIALGFIITLWKLYPSLLSLS